MEAKIRRTISIFLLIIVVIALSTTIAGAVAKSNLAKKYPAPGQLVDVGGYNLHINCMGQGSPTVILEAGLGDFSLTWAFVQPEVATTTRVCSYDRAGYGWSEPGPQPRTTNTEVEELHTLLTNAKIQGPYVLVGHSLGGMLVRMYTHSYPEEVVGMVLVDSLHEDKPIRLPEIQAKTDQITIKAFRMLKLLSSSGMTALAPQFIPNDGLPEDVFEQRQAILAKAVYYKTTMDEVNALQESCAEVRALHINSFGNLPFIVLSSGRSEASSSLSDAENQALWAVWQELQSELALLSSESKQIMAEQSGHNIQLDQPDLVIDAVREILNTIR